MIKCIFRRCNLRCAMIRPVASPFRQTDNCHYSYFVCHIYGLLTKDKQTDKIASRSLIKLSKAAYVRKWQSCYKHASYFGTCFYQVYQPKKLQFHLLRSYTQTYVLHQNHQTTTAGAADFATMTRNVNFMVLVVWICMRSLLTENFP